MLVVSLAMPGLTPAKMAAYLGIIALLIIGYAACTPKLYRASAIGLVGVILFSGFAASITNGGVDGYVTPVLLAGPIAAALFLGGREAALAGAAVILCFFTLFGLDWLGLIAETPYSANQTRVGATVLLSLTMLACTLAMTQFSANRDKLIKHLLASNAAIAEAEAAARQSQEFAEEKQAEAELASRTREEFLSNMSHEIRTPLNGIVGLTAVLATTHLTAQQSELVGLVRRSSGTLVRLVDDLLNHYRLASVGLSECFSIY